jgi:hypothetical protein
MLYAFKRKTNKLIKCTSFDDLLMYLKVSQFHEKLPSEVLGGQVGDELCHRHFVQPVVPTAALVSTDERLFVDAAERSHRRLHFLVEDERRFVRDADVLKELGPLAEVLSALDDRADHGTLHGQPTLNLKNVF